MYYIVKATPVDFGDTVFYEPDEFYTYNEITGDYELVKDLEKYVGKTLRLKAEKVESRGARRQIVGSQKVILETENDVSVYTVFAVMKAKADDDWYRFITADTKRDYDSKINYAKTHSFYVTGITPEYNKQLLTLSTCYGGNNDNRILVLAVEN